MILLDMAARLASLIVPVFDEGPSLAANLRTLLEYLDKAESSYEYEVIVVDDGSVDDSYNVAQQAAFVDRRLRVIRHAENLGLGCAIRSGIALARSDAAVVYDSDLSYPPEIIPRLLARLELHNDDLVLASPYMSGGGVKNVPFVRRVLSREGNRFLSFATNGRYFTLTCMVRAYRTAFFRALDSCEARMEINPEVVFKALALGARVSEIPAELVWSEERAKSRARLNIVRTIRQSFRTMRYGVAYRPAVLLALPGILPGVLPLVIAAAVLMHMSVKTILMITLGTMIVQNASLALFAGQLAVFGRNVVRRRRLDASADKR